MRQLTTMVFLLLLAFGLAAADERPRARDVDLVIGIFPTGELNAITDVDGVRVGHATIIEGGDIRTGVTAIISGLGNVDTHPVPARIHVGNGYGKLVGKSAARSRQSLNCSTL